jgi:NitT/TauT family transport system permease protein
MPRIVNRHPSRGTGWLLGLAPFIALLCVYLVGSHIRTAENPDDKLLPTPSTIVSTMHSYTAEEDVRSGEVLFWVDTLASLKRILIALTLSASIGLALGLAVGAVPMVRAMLAPFIGAVAMIPPLAILPILFITLGLGEVAKITLITIGIAPCIVRDLSMRAAELPTEQLIKAQTLGASSWQLVVRVILPQMWPRLIDSLRLNMGSAWLFLIAAEAIASEEGLGYRIFLVRRYLAMDVILPYVVWITVLAFAMDYALKLLRSRAFPWTEMSR